MAHTVVKMVDFSYKPSSAFPRNAVYAAPPPQQFKAAPPGIRTREHRIGPRSSHPAGFHPPNSPSRIGSPQPVLRCKRRSQLPRYRAPVRPHVLHSLPHGYGEGDLNAIADRTNPPAGDALRTAEQATGQHQARLSRVNYICRLASISLAGSHPLAWPRCWAALVR